MSPDVLCPECAAVVLEDECDVKHCEEPSTLGMTWVLNGVRVEIFTCQAHFDALNDDTEASG